MKVQRINWQFCLVQKFSSFVSFALKIAIIYSRKGTIFDEMFLQEIKYIYVC